MIDAMLNRTARVLRVTNATKDSYGNKSTAPTEVARVACRISYSTRGRAREYKSEKNAAISLVTVFMRPLDGLTTADTLDVDGQKLNIIEIADAGGLGHHLEVLCEAVKP